MVPIWYRVIIGKLLGRPWTCHIQECVPYASMETIPRVIQSMHTIGNNCEEILSFITHRKLTETTNILKYQLSSGDSHGNSHQQDKSG